MAKATKTGNVAVAGITPTTTKEPTVTASGKTASQAEKEQKAANQAATVKTSTSTKSAEIRYIIL